MFSAFSFRDNSNNYRTTALRRVRDGDTDLSGKVIVVTGATGAMGKELSFAFYKGGATVILTGRSLAKAEKAKEDVLAKKIPEKEEFEGKEGGSVVPMCLDLGDYDSIERFVKDVKAQFPKVYALVNNAGAIPGSSFQASKYGHETTFQTNFLSTVILTELMMPLLQNGDDDDKAARIVNVSSMSHHDASNPIKWNVIPSTKETFGGYNKDYAESKWLLNCYTSHLSRTFPKVQSLSADPGISPDSSMWDQQIALIRFLARRVFYYLTKKTPQAAGCAAQLVVAEEVQNGGYYSSGVLGNARGDCEDPQEWAKAVVVLKKTLPEHLKEDMMKSLEE